MQQSSLEQLRQEQELETKSKTRLRWVTDHLGLVVLLSTMAMYFATLNGIWATDHSSAILDFQYSLWSDHSFIVGKVGSFTVNSVDLFQYKGNYFMANAPGVAFLTLPGAIAAFILNAGHFTVFGKALLFTEVPIAIANSFAAYFIFKIGNYYFQKDVSAFLALCYAFSTISWPFATYLFQSDVSALFDLLAAFLVIKIDRSNSLNSSSGKVGSFVFALITGLAVTCGTFTDYVNGILVPIIGIYLFFALRKSRKKIIAKNLTGFLTGSLVVSSILFGLYNYLSFGRVFVSSEQLYLHSSSILGNFTFPVDMGMILNLFTPMRGLFFFSPILILGVWGLWKMMRDSTTDRESFLFLSIFLGIIGLYSAWYAPDGGLSFGPRLIISSIPFLLIPAGFIISNARGRFSYAFVYLLYAAGVCINGSAAFTGALAPPTKSWLVSPFFSLTLPDLLAGKVDIWWKSSLGDFWVVVMAIVLGFALFFPMTCSYLSEKVYCLDPRGDGNNFRLTKLEQ